MCVHARCCEHKFSELPHPEVGSRIQKNDPRTKRMLLISLPHTVVSCDAHTHTHTQLWGQDSRSRICMTLLTLLHPQPLPSEHAGNTVWGEPAGSSLSQLLTAIWGLGTLLKGTSAVLWHPPGHQKHLPTFVGTGAWTENPLLLGPVPYRLKYHHTNYHSILFLLYYIIIHTLFPDLFNGLI